MIVYLETSSLVKLYVEEAGSDRIRELVRGASIVSTSIVAYVEARAALARQRREGGLTPPGYGRAKIDLDRDWPRFLAVEATEAICRAAGDLAEKHRLRGFDSLHLASYLSLLRRSGPRPTAFSSFDDRLNRAARRESRETAR